jgi:hypothetical protein
VIAVPVQRQSVAYAGADFLVAAKIDGFNVGYVGTAGAGAIGYIMRAKV